LASVGSAMWNLGSILIEEFGFDDALIEKTAR
jgi:hypothetical protein